VTTTLDSPAPPPVTRSRTLGFAAVLAASVMDLLDSTIVTVAAPDIRAELGGSYAVVQWMAVGYTLALGVLLLVGGRLGDIVGRRRMMLGGIAGFTTASLLCALAWSPEVLLGGRVLQGAFAALMLPQAFGLIRDLFPPAEMAKAWGVLGPVMGLGAVFGPVIGGLLLDADLFGTGWRAIFLVNLPIGIAAFAVARRHLPSIAPTATRASLDLPGAALAAAATVMLVYPLVEGRELGWPAWTLLLPAASIVTFGLFARRQVRLSRAGRATLVEVSLFTKRSYVAGAGFAVTFLAAMGAMFTVGVMLQIGLGYTPLAASLTMAPWAFGAFGGSVISAVTMARAGRRLLHIGLALMAAGVLGLIGVYQWAGTDLGFVDLLGPLAIGGIGMGMIFVPLYDIILTDVEPHETGSATGVLKSTDQLGMTLGVAVLGTVFFALLGPVPTPAAALHAGTVTALVTLVLLAAAFGLGFLLPQRARAHAE
jgi:EmrB/QacA subfamily drug resistance transporter